jgi:hypothetical protein
MVYRWFTRPDARQIYPGEDHDMHSRAFTATPGSDSHDKLQLRRLAQAGQGLQADPIRRESRRSAAASSEPHPLAVASPAAFWDD